MVVYSIDADKNRSAWRTAFPSRVLFPILGWILLFIILNNFSLVRMGTNWVQFVGITILILLLLLGIWFYQYFAISNKFSIEVQEEGFQITLPTRQVYMPRNDFVVVRERSDGLFIMNKQNRALYIPITLNNYDQFKADVTSWLPYEVIPKEVEHASRMSGYLVLLLVGTLFLTLSTSSLYLIAVINILTLAIFGIFQFYSRRWGIPPQVSRQNNKVLFIFIGLLVLASIYHALPLL